jgi:malate permease and related proteins
MLLANTLLVFTQVMILFVLIAVGYIARKAKLVDDNGLRQMTNILLIIVMPTVIISAFQTPFDRELLQGLLIVFAVSLVAHVLGALIARMLFRKVPEAQAKVLRFAVVFSNCGFFTIPLLNAVLGSRGVFYGSAYIAVFNIVTWTYGVLLMTGRKSEINIKRALINPGTIGLLIGLPLFVLKISLPEVLQTVVKLLASTNTPLAMLVIGGQMAVVPMLLIFKNRQVFIASFFRLIIIPGIIMLILHLFPFGRELILSCILPAAAPTAAATALFATKHDQDTAIATTIIAFSTLFAIVTIPLLILLSDLISRA